MELSGKFHAPAASPLRKEPLYPPNRSLGGPQTQSRHFAADKKVCLSTYKLWIVQHIAGWSGVRIQAWTIRNYAPYYLDSDLVKYYTVKIQSHNLNLTTLKSQISHNELDHKC
jgi:hypothetical protein